MALLESTAARPLERVQQLIPEVEGRERDRVESGWIEAGGAVFQPRKFGSNLGR